MAGKTGYVLLYSGIIVVIFAAVSMVLALTATIKPVQFYQPEDISLDFSRMVPSYQIPGLPEAIRPDENLNTDLASSEVLSDSFNLLIHMFLMGFLVNVGTKLATLGGNLVRPIVVKVNKQEQVISPKQPDNSANSPQ
ncbi:MAG: hypothetical protein UU81_C0010G0056 [Microgenomates group bacterium GW2011_GWC1_41_8]|uniref:Uncharacterized protein n=3 Tax=Candidatus Roizmaniibacteriota TaxID=1752723 RepID=A0A0G0XEA4_9BACT|nr:MAG: hypothetical protein UU14_C0003G0073 [Candidatus Roizmanbacteria bacterium GW2011_GWB1_40_7]KKR94585.1 MAG: hypothetical protein UU41_C0005G0043 [Candidatus Roizmanbacteria bacterium GW2011_GWA1_41_13]KKS23155.1 MAG: hypothetical protein UU78_C0002G0008 [Candidatus Roizmanbacteria bacterium GW2011_GWC2_41_7]KKS24273.1 MAG: hypothetical protein UU81_C0010G0056 [Microgenomates group bacterium GW2011_GWC1_41_8]OGK48397.1 MAG: hypothetical protein A3A55_04210 [Candidatus Roizmanbacteria bac